MPISDRSELSDIKDLLPETWFPGLPLTERIAKLVEGRRYALHPLELMAVRVETLERQRTAMRRSYLNLLQYALRVVELEYAVANVLQDFESYDDGVDEKLLEALRDARNRLGVVVDVTPPNTNALDLYLGRPPPSVMLRGERLDAFLALLRWVSGFLEADQAG